MDAELSTDSGIEASGGEHRRPCGDGLRRIRPYVARRADDGRLWVFGHLRRDRRSTGNGPCNAGNVAASSTWRVALIPTRLVNISRDLTNICSISHVGIRGIAAIEHMYASWS